MTVTSSSRAVLFFIVNRKSVNIMLVKSVICNQIVVVKMRLMDAEKVVKSVDDCLNIVPGK